VTQSEIKKNETRIDGPRKVAVVARKFAEEGDKHQDSVEGAALRAVLAEHHKNPRESWPVEAIAEENKELAAEIARLKEEAPKMEKHFNMIKLYSFGMYAAVDDSWSSFQWAEDVSALSNTCESLGYTSIMMRNIPNNYTRAHVLKLLEKEGFSGAYDFFYLPIDLKTKSGLGYAFINFVNHESAIAFQKHFDGFSNWVATSGKVCKVTFSDRIQGLKQHVERYRNSSIMHESVPDEFKPMLFENGVPVRFPAPTKNVVVPQER
jgi:hypothetical protein